MKVEIRSLFDNKLISNKIRHISFSSNKISSFVIAGEDEDEKINLRVKDTSPCALFVDGVEVPYDEMKIYKDGKKATRYKNISDLIFDSSYKMIGFKVRTFENGKEKYFKTTSNHSVFIIIGEQKVNI